jgi:integrase
MKLSEIRRSDLQAFVDRLLNADHDPSTIRNTLMPVRAIFRRALVRGEVAINPTTGLELPAVRGRRDRIASPEEAATLLAALPEDRTLWATAMYAGLRLGELLALDWSAVDLDAGLIHVRRSWDPKEGPVTPKSRAGIRSVPVPQVLRSHLVVHEGPWRPGSGHPRRRRSP